jgi:hypothetical protein
MRVLFLSFARVQLNKNWIIIITIVITILFSGLFIRTKRFVYNHSVYFVPYDG